jgi:hypothetical protein
MEDKSTVIVQKDSESSQEPGSQNESASPFTPAEERKIIHKIDRRLVVLLGVMYCVSLMDRSNLANAKVAG